MHVRLVHSVLEVVQAPFVWGLSLLSFLVGVGISFLQSVSWWNNPVILGLLSIFGGIITGVVFRYIDIWNEKRKERLKKKQEEIHETVAEQAQDFLEQTSLRAEERDFFNSLILVIEEQKRIASLRGHAMNGEIERLRAILFNAFMNEGKVPRDAVIYNQELSKYLAELENTPLPPLTPRPKSLVDPKSSSPELPKMS